MEIDLKVSTVFERISTAMTKIVVNEGSSRSTKTFSILQYIILEHLEHKGLVTTICRFRLTWLKATIIPDFKEIMGEGHLDLWIEANWNKSESTYKINGGVIQFIGLDEAQKLHGRKQDMFWINEAIEADYKSFQQLILRTKKKVILDYNPSEEQHWIYSKVITRDDCTFIKSTYLDNPFLDQEIVDEIERLEPTPYNIEQGTADEVSWKIYGLGERAAHRGLIFGDSKIVKELPPKEHWKKMALGLDFGYTNDPTACIMVILAYGELWLDEIFYKKRLVNRKNENVPKGQSIEEQFEENGITKQDKIAGDSGEPKSISDLRSAGYNIVGAQKGPDSVRNGIDSLKEYKINITERSINLLKERSAYKWKIDKEGNATNVPIDIFNHGWDAVRYGFTTYIKSGGISLSELLEDFD